MFIERKRWSPDAFFYDTFLDLTALEFYIGILEVELPHVIEGQRKQIWQDVKEGDEEAQHYALLLLDVGQRADQKLRLST